MTIATQTPTRELARFAAGLRYSDLPPAVREMSRHCLLDWLGNAIHGSRQPIAPILCSLVEQLGGNEQATVVGLGLRTSIANAAMLNASFSHCIDYDDYLMEGFVHCSAPVWAATLALAEWLQASAEEATAAFVAGYEVMARIAVAIGAAMLDANAHVTGVLGYYGGAAAAGRLLGLDEGQMARAFGIACGQAGALIIVRGTMSKPFLAGHSAHGGVLSALMAHKGWETVTNALEGPAGVLETFARNRDVGDAFAGLGERYLLLNNRFKPYACCALSHTMLDGLLGIRREAALDPSEIESINLHLLPFATSYLGRPEVASGLAGKFSAQYCSSVALLDGDAQEPQFTDERAADPALRQLMARVRLVPTESLTSDQSEVEILLKNGRSFRRRTDSPSGSPANPLPWDRLVAKFRSLAQVALPADRLNNLVDRVADWPATRVADLVAAAVS